MEQNNIHIWDKIGMVGSGIRELDDHERVIYINTNRFLKKMWWYFGDDIIFHIV